MPDIDFFCHTCRHRRPMEQLFCRKTRGGICRDCDQRIKRLMAGKAPHPKHGKSDVEKARRYSQNKAHRERVGWPE